MLTLLKVWSQSLWNQTVAYVIELTWKQREKTRTSAGSPCFHVIIVKTTFFFLQHGQDLSFLSLITVRSMPFKWIKILSFLPNISVVFSGQSESPTWLEIWNHFTPSVLFRNSLIMSTTFKNSTAQIYDRTVAVTTDLRFNATKMAFFEEEQVEHVVYLKQ